MQVLGVLEAHAVCYNVLCAADERVLVVQAVQTTHLRYHPCQTGAAVFSWQKTERLLLLWHQPTERVDCIVLHSMTRSNSPDGSHHHITTPITSMFSTTRTPKLTVHPKTPISEWTALSRNGCSRHPHHDTNQLSGKSPSSSTLWHQTFHRIEAVSDHTTTPIKNQWIDCIDLHQINGETTPFSTL